MIELLKAAFKTGLGTAGTLGFGIITTKIMAVVLGPGGVGLLSLLRQIRQTAVTMGTLNGGTALVQGIASRDGEARNTYIRVVLRIILIVGAIICLGLGIFAPKIANMVLGRGDPVAILLIRWLALPVFLGILLAFLGGILNGYRAIGRLAMLGVVSAFVTALVAWPVANSVKNGNPLAFIEMMTISATFTLVMAFYFFWRGGYLEPLIGRVEQKFKIEASRHFFSVSGTMLITGLATTGAQLAVRAMVVHAQGLFGAGIFAVAWTLSMMYVGLVTQSFGTYYLPTLSGITDAKERILLMQRLFRLTILIMTPVVVAVVVLKPFVVHLLYSLEFTPSLKIIRWMLIGDYFKVTSWVLAFPILAYTDMRTFIWSEFLFTTMQLFGVYVAVIQWNNLEGIGITFLVLYVCYLVFTLAYCRLRHGFTLTRTMGRHWLAGLVLLLTASFFTWNATTVNYSFSVGWITAACVISWFGLTQDERNKVRALLPVNNLRKNR